MVAEYKEVARSSQDIISELIDRRLIVSDRSIAEAFIDEVGYHRLKGYFPPFQRQDRDGHALDNKQFKNGVKLEDIQRLYEWDWKFRLTFLDQLGRLEIRFRASLVRLIQGKDGLGYLDPAILGSGVLNAASVAEQGEFDNPQMDESGEALTDVLSNPFLDLINRLVSEFRDRRKYPDAQYFFSTYGRNLPIWIIMEHCSFSDLLKIYRCLNLELQLEFAKEYTNAEYADYALSIDDIQGFLTLLTWVRNGCAHHERVWDRVFEWSKNPGGDYFDDWDAFKRMYGLALLAIFLDKNRETQDDFRNKMYDLLSEIVAMPFVNENLMGVPHNWQSHPAWQGIQVAEFQDR